MNPPLEMMGGLLVVALLWGVTTPLMRRESLDESKQQKNKNSTNHKPRHFLLLINLLSRWKFLCVYLLNQTGSLAYYALLGTYDLMVISPLANGLAFVFTFITESFLEKRNPRREEVLGASLVILGFSLCLRARGEE